MVEEIVMIFGNTRYSTVLFYYVHDISYLAELLGTVARRINLKIAQEAGSTHFPICADMKLVIRWCDTPFWESMVEFLKSGRSIWEKNEGGTLVNSAHSRTTG